MVLYGTFNLGLMKQNLICVTCHVSDCVQSMNQPMIMFLYRLIANVFILECYCCIMPSDGSAF